MSTFISQEYHMLAHSYFNLENYKLAIQALERTMHFNGNKYPELNIECLFEINQAYTLMGKQIPLKTKYENRLCNYLNPA